MTCVEKKFELQVRKWEEYKGTRYSDGDIALVVELWLNRVADDTSGLTFQEWDPSAGSDDTSALVAMLVNSSELCAADFPLAEVRPLQLDEVTRGVRRTRGAAVRKLRVWVTVRLYSPWKTTMTSGQDVSEFLDTLGLVKSYFFKFFEKKKLKKSRIFFFGCSDAPEDQVICLFAGLLAKPDMPLSLEDLMGRHFWVGC
jgi:hypothetical protein